MKTIAVLVDFSDRSEHVARYALHLAKQIKANLLLLNAFLVPADMAMSAGQIAWPLNEYEGIKADSEKTLKDFCNRLKHGQQQRPQPGHFLPSINCQCKEGPVINALFELQMDKEIILVVAGTHGSDAVTSFLLGNNARELINNSELPLLLVPENTVLKDLHNIIFATDLHLNDISYINAVAGLAQVSNANVGIVNVLTEKHTDTRHNRSENAFMQQMVLNVDYKRVSFRNIRNQQVNKGIDDVLLHEKPDLLVMVHRKGAFFESLFKSSITQKVASHAAVPILVYPYPAQYIPAF